MVLWLNFLQSVVFSSVTGSFTAFSDLISCTGI